MNSKKYCECVGTSVEDCGCRDVIGEVIAEDNARPIHPAVAEYLASEFKGPAKHTATSDGERVAELELLNAELWRQNEEQAREIERLQNDIAYFPPTVRALTETIGQLRDELAALKSQPCKIPPEVAGIGRDSGHPRAVVLYLRKEPDDDDIRAIQECLRQHSAALKAQPSGVALPERAELDRMWREIQDSAMRSQESPHIRFAEQLARLNSSPVSAGDGMCNADNPAARCICREEFGRRVCAGGVDERAAFEAIEWLDDFVARCNGDDRGSCESVNIIRAALNAGSAVPDGDVYRRAVERIAGIGSDSLHFHPSHMSRIAREAMKAAAPTAKKEG